jgi:hypothetical protein
VCGTLAAAALGAVVSRQASRRQLVAQERRDLDRALGDYLTATMNAVATLSRMPDVDPDQWFNRCSNLFSRGKAALFGPTVDFVQAEKQLRRVFGPRPFASAEHHADADVRLRLLRVGRDFEVVMDKVSDYLIDLATRRTDDVLDRWPALHRELTEAAQKVRARS